jgi:hypothetical protein
MNVHLLLLVLAAAAVLLACAASQAGEVTVVLDERLAALDIGRMALGQGGLSAEPMWDGRVAEVRALHPKLIRLFIQEYFDLLPEGGRYNFQTLDRSVDAILRTGAKPLMCICFKPRVLFPKIDQDLVEPTDYGQWGKLIEQLVAHYARRGAGIRYWEIGNEPDIGESGGCPYRFKPESYCRYYQRTAAAILRADPNALVGGPALANVRSPILPALMKHCQDGNVPLHFISWHIYSSSPPAVRGTIDYAKGLLAQHTGLKCQTFLDEWNMDLGLPPRDGRIQPCFVAETVGQMIDAGLDFSCYYQIRDWHVAMDDFTPFMSPTGAAFMWKWWNHKAQFDGLFDFQNEVRPTYFTFKLLSRLTGQRLQLRASETPIRGLATWDERLGTYNLMLWNFTASPAEATLVLRNAPGNLRAWPIALDAAGARNDENSRLLPDSSVDLPADKATLPIRLDAYGVRFWSIERR